MLVVGVLAEPMLNVDLDVEVVLGETGSQSDHGSRLFVVVGVDPKIVVVIV
jgi:hypothetical protein